jgi:Flp pilus assembly protein TadG
VSGIIARAIDAHRKNRPGGSSGGGACRPQERGAAAVEFAIVVPFLCFLLFAVIDYGYMLSFRQALSQEAAEGARAAAVAPGSVPDTAIGNADSLQNRAVQAVNQGLASYDVSCTNGGLLMHGTDQAGVCTVSLPPQACTGSTTGAMCVEVTLSYTYSDDPLLPSFPGVGVVLPDHMTYTTEAQVS